ncbi:uncharacterized protein VTP21DRAFT_3297 [Calcarisporiella thermophila]|uniref:uncharacterized protein n=1 Tax=Calcarisporiella thermophila TaxID=911321 RepID=UPI0037441595
MPIRAKSWSFATTIPEFTGPFRVGCHDIELVYKGGMSEGHPEEGSKVAGEKLSKGLEGLLVRLYYPAEPQNNHLTSWLPTPMNLYGQGYGDFAKIPKWISTPVFVWSLMYTKIPAFLNAPLASDKNRFPVVVFSHGIGCNRSTYSYICGQLASAGCVVCAVEHRDGSASFSHVKRKQPLEYVHPVDPSAMEFRREQVKHRLEEVNACWELVKKLEDGHLVENIFEERIDLGQFKGRLDLENAVMAGHSFGGCTTIEVLKNPDAPFKVGITLDPWMEPFLGTPTVTRPLIVINSEGFTKWLLNFRLVEAMMKNAPKNSRLFTILGSGHQNHSDIPALFPTLSRRFTKSTGPMDPALALELNARLIFEFLRQYVPNIAEKIPVDSKILSDNPTERPVEIQIHQ